VPGFVVEVIGWVIVFLLGTAVGSFINVLIDRSVAGEDWVRGRSHCDFCRKNLRWYDLIPVFSWLAYRGKSRCCHTPLPYRYPLVEFLTGLLFVWWFMIGFWFFHLTTAPLSTIQPAFWLVTGLVLLILAVSDARYGVVLTPVVYGGVILTLVYRLLLTYFGVYQTNDLVSSLLMSAGAYGFFWLLNRITAGRGMAEGDMDVALYFGLLLGWPRGLIGLGLSFVLGALIGLLLIGLKIKSRKDTVPFVPFMVTATLIMLLWGEQIIGFLG
jgi:leader peptidase (prepilin peptidase)/N-methyltransferase